MLVQGGVDDLVWLETVRLHHDASVENRPLEQLTPGQRLALLLRRVDIYAAVLSRRTARAALTPMEAARKVCLGADGRPDLVGAALLRTTGLYPPGSFVELVSRELAVVFSRGARADQPLVAVLVNAQGEPLLEPRLRDTAQLGCAVRKAVRPDQVPVEPSAAAWTSMQKAARHA
ncbi:HD-GYP domain-containing protein [Azohydromonas lata]|uniref:Uncharacterized protein n=1 Tax=Azohydromonas lata TaxID=45677 RepID=A0ABU5I8J4_9BURK|nr:hypothetical protein [Azohydromonas lata]MDZ5455288.1 hypothetical protein [Azohydromonas lata]